MNVDVTILSNTVYVVTDETGRVTISSSNPSPGQAGIYWLDEGVALGTRGTVDQINFVGAGVTVTRSGNALTVTVTSGGGSGDVTGPAGSTDNNIAVYNGATGKIIKDGGKTIATITAEDSKAVLVLAHNTVGQTITNMVLAEAYAPFGARCVFKFDSTRYTRARLVVNVFTASTSANTPRLYAKHKSSYTNGDAVGTFTTLGTGSGTEAVSLAAVAVLSSDWITLPAGAIGDVFWCLASIGGDGAADPVISQAFLEFDV